MKKQVILVFLFPALFACNTLICMEDKKLQSIELLPSNQKKLETLALDFLCEFTDQHKEIITKDELFSEYQEYIKQEAPQENITNACIVLNNINKAIARDVEEKIRQLSTDKRIQPILMDVKKEAQKTLYPEKSLFYTAICLEAKDMQRLDKKRENIIFERAMNFLILKTIKEQKKINTVTD